MTKKITNPHDKLFKASLKYPKVAKDFLKMYLPEFIQNNLDFDKLTYCDNTFIDEELKLSESDVLFSTNFLGKKSFIYLLCEHQSTVDPLMALRLFKYMLAIWEAHIAQQDKGSSLPLPIIFPLIFYTGAKPYTGKTALWELCEDSKIMWEILKSPFHLVDTTILPEALLTSHVWAGTMSFIMRKQFSLEFKKNILSIINNLNTLALAHDNQYLTQLINYIMTINEHTNNKEEFIAIIEDRLSPQLKGTIMNLAERIKQEGIEEGMHKGMEAGMEAGMHKGMEAGIHKGMEAGIHKGMEAGIHKGKLETARLMLELGADLDFIHKATQISLQELKNLFKK